MSNVVRFSSPIQPEDVVEMQVVNFNNLQISLPGSYTITPSSKTRWMGWFGRDSVNESAVNLIRLLNGLGTIKDKQCEDVVDYIDEQHPNWKAMLSTVQRRKEQEANRERKKALKALRKDPGTSRAFDVGSKYNSFSKQEIYSKKARNR